MAKNSSAQSPLETTSFNYLDQKLLVAKRYAHGSESWGQGCCCCGNRYSHPDFGKCKDAAMGKRANLNHTAQALIISTVAGAAYFIVADKTVLATARKNSFNQASNFEA